MTVALRVTVAAFALTAAVPAYATVDIIASSGSGQVTTDENVLLPSGQSGETVFGETNNTHEAVTFHSLNGDILTTPANGQARIESTDGSLKTLEFFLTDPTAFFKTFEFNIFKSVEGLQSVTVTYAGSQGGSETFSDFVGTGSNWISGLATGNDYFQKISYTTSGIGTTDIRQIRLGGVGTIAAVPEPAAWMLMLVGFAAIGATMRRRRGNVTARVRFA